jgi:hypothetical protein
MALHRRFGFEDSSYMKDGFFQPFLHSGDASTAAIVGRRNWMLFAQSQHNDGHALKGEAGTNAVHLVALSTGRNQEGNSPSHYLTAFVQLPSRPSTGSAVTVKQVSFYGDDGNSSLTVLNEQSKLQDETSGSERRQRLAILVDIVEKSENTALVTEELWLVDYNNAIFRQEQIGDNEHADDAVVSILLRSPGDTCSTSTIRFGSHENDDEDGNLEPGVLAAKRTLLISILLRAPAAFVAMLHFFLLIPCMTPSLTIFLTCCLFLLFSSPPSFEQYIQTLLFVAGRIIQTQAIESDPSPSNSPINTSRFVACGSRGVGCVVSNQTVLGLYDLEEDDDEESDNGENESMESGGD